MSNQQESHRKNKSSTQMMMMRRKNNRGRGKKHSGTLSTNLVKQQPEIQVRLRKLNQITIEQSIDAVLQQLKAKLRHEEYSENILQQDARFRHYANNLERIVVKDEILTRQ